MQKDMHFDLTFWLALCAGWDREQAEQLAWANQYTDHMTEQNSSAHLYNIQTQCGNLENWADRQVQLTVLIPFHFIPGDKGNWIVSRDSRRVNQLVRNAGGHVFRLGIALHAYQDSFSHENFSGWREPANSCYPWWYLNSALPNIGHAEMMVIPDVANYVWVDPRTSETIVNRERFMQAAFGTFESLILPITKRNRWAEIHPEINRLACLHYDDRVAGIRYLIGEDPSFKKTNLKLEPRYAVHFAEAAVRHLSHATKLFAALPIGLDQMGEGK